MQARIPFRLNRSGLLLALISAGFAGGAGAAAGKVDFVTSGVTVAGRDGQARPLARGAELDSGDRVRTSAEGRAQIRFNDGSYVSLQPNTDFAINEYKFEGKDDDRGFFGLVRGAMRTVTGAVGRVNRNSYRITTPTATVGIRGTGGVIQVQNDGSTLVIGTSGIWSLTNPAGSIDIPAGVSGLAPTEPNTPPKETTTQPQTSPAPVQPQRTEFVQGEQVTPEGTADLGTTTPPIVPLISGTGYAAALAFQSSFFGITGNGNADAVFDPTGRLTEVKFSDSQFWKLNGVHQEFGTDGMLAWGRWTGNVTGVVASDGLLSFDQTYSDNQGLHYVIGKPTLTMPTSGTATYSIYGATNPTYVSGATAPGTLTGGTLAVAFSSGITNVALQNLSIDMPAGGGMTARNYTLNGSTVMSGTSSIFSMFPTVSIDGVSCSSGCQAQARGFFSGASAERAGLSYMVQGAGQAVVGAAALKK
jgi:hypothetical protein